ncbi:MAG: YybS family protein [Bacillota bacterium]|nr:YybS family protein [Bacillota bacterium]
MAERLTSTKALVEGALAAALAAVLALVGYYLPPLSMITTLVWFIPIVVVIVRQNMRWGVMSLVVATLVMMMLSHPLSGFLTALQMGFVALVYGYGFKNKWSAGKIILTGGIAVVISAIIVIALSITLMGVNLGEWQQEMALQIDHSIEMYRQWGLLDQGGEEELRNTMEALIHFIGLIIPGLLISGSLLTAAVNFLLVRVVLKRVGVEIRPIPPFREWQLPWYLIWGIIGGLILLLGGDYFNLDLVNTIGLNILYFYFPILFIAGLSVLSFFNYHLKIARWIKIMTLIVFVVNLPFAVVLITSLGLFDPLFNYRRLVNQAKK